MRDFSGSSKILNSPPESRWLLGPCSKEKQEQMVYDLPCKTATMLWAMRVLVQARIRAYYLLIATTSARRTACPQRPWWRQCAYFAETEGLLFDCRSTPAKGLAGMIDWISTTTRIQRQMTPVDFVYILAAAAAWFGYRTTPFELEGLCRIKPASILRQYQD